MPTDPIERFVLVNAWALFALGVFIGVVNPQYLGIYTAEDGLLEWLTVMAMCWAALALGNRLWRRGRLQNRRQRLLLVCLIALAVFGAGEEVSWGQRIVGFESPAFFAENNAQRETTLHNLVAGGVSVNKVVFSKGLLLLFLLYVFLVKPLWHRSNRAASFFDGWGVPIPKRYHYVGYLLVIVIVEGLLNAVTDAPRRGELTEFMVTVLATLNLVYPLNRNVIEGEHSAPARRRPA